MEEEWKKKVYGVYNEEKTAIVGSFNSIEDANRLVDASYPFIVELTVTKVFKRGTDYVEVKD